MAEYGGRPGMHPKADVPANTFPVSMLPWAGFSAFHLHLQEGYRYLAPIFTMGRFHGENGRILLPLAVQAHHGVCDGFHLCRMANELQALLNGEAGQEQ